MHWTTAGNCSGWKLTWQKDFLFCLFCCLIFLPDPWATVHCTCRQTALLAWWQRWCRGECCVSTSVSSSLHCASQVASNKVPCYEELYFSVILFIRTLGTHLACIFPLMNFWFVYKTGRKPPSSLTIGSICWREQQFPRFKEQRCLLCWTQVLQQNFVKHCLNCCCCHCSLLANITSQF